MKRLTAKLLAGLSAFGLISAHSAQAQSFRSEAEARAYLSQNPAGPRADEAFRLIIRGTVADSHPEFSRRALRDGIATSLRGASGASAADVDAALKELATGKVIVTSDGGAVPRGGGDQSGTSNGGEVY